MTDQGFEQTRPGYPAASGQPAGAAGYGQSGPTGADAYAPPQQQFSDAKGFAASLFDFGFTSFVTPKVVKVVYVLIMILLGLGGIASAIFAFEFGGSIAGIFTLVIVAPLVFFVYLSLWRIALEIFIVVFRVAEDVRAIREHGFR